MASEDLTIRIESYIVRKMKMHKKMKYVELIKDIETNLASFRPDPLVNFPFNVGNSKLY
jgi:hypothetical protein